MKRLITYIHSTRSSQKTVVNFDDLIAVKLENNTVKTKLRTHIDIRAHHLHYHIHNLNIALKTSQAV